MLLSVIHKVAVFSTVLPSTLKSKNKLTRLGTPAHRQRMLEVGRTRKVTVSKRHTMTVYWNVKINLLAFKTAGPYGRKWSSSTQRSSNSCGTLVTKSEFSQNASKVKTLSFFGAKNGNDFYNIAVYIKKMHIYEIHNFITEIFTENKQCTD